MSELFDQNLLGEFVNESREHLDSIEPDLLDMERGETTVSPELINRIFRAIHSIKGGAGFLCFESLKRLSHSMESVLMNVRDGSMPMTSEIADVLLRGVDKLRAMVDDVQSSDQVPCSDVMEDLKRLLGDGSPPVAPPISLVAARSGQSLLEGFDKDHDSVRLALKHGTPLYRVEVRSREDLLDANRTLDAFMGNVQILGEYIGPNLGHLDISALAECVNREETFSFLFSTVLEADLAASALELPKSQVLFIDTTPPSAVDAPVPEPNSLGELLVKSGAAIPEAVAHAIQVQLEGDSRKLGEILVADRGASPDAIQDALSRQENQKTARKKQETAETLRVRVDLLNRLMNTAGELVLARNQLIRMAETELRGVRGAGTLMHTINRVTTDIQAGIMQTRLQPVGSVFGRFPRVVRDLARKIGKEIEITMEGGDVEMDKSMVELLADPLTHLVRNCADHAIETPAERAAAGKPAEGLIRLRAYHEGGQVNISIEDDGRGIDPEKIGRKAIEKGVITQAQFDRMSGREVIQLIFAAGFSTAEVVSDISGRGVGMDVVRSNIEQLGGTVSLDSEKGSGTTVVLQLPLTLAIIQALIVGACERRYALPQVNVDEIVWIRPGDIQGRVQLMQGREILRLRGLLLPIVRLVDVLGTETAFVDPRSGGAERDRRDRIADRRGPAVDESVEASRGPDRRAPSTNGLFIVIVKSGAKLYGVSVDEVFDIEEIVVKPLSTFVKEVKCFSGATILGDGRVITILDVEGIASLAHFRSTDMQAEALRRGEEEEMLKGEQEGRKRSILLFDGAPGERFAVPQESILRLETVDTNDIETVGGREFVRYRGKGLPLVRLDAHLNVGALPEAVCNLFMIIPRTARKGMAAEARGGILATHIVDSLDAVFTVEPAPETRAGLLGTVIIDDRLTTFLEPAQLLESAGIAWGDGQ